MVLSNKEIFELSHGAINYKIKDNGYISLYRFSDEQIDYFKFNDFFYVRTMFQSSITIEFNTDANSFSFKYNISCVGSKDTFDLYINNQMYEIIDINKIDLKGELEFNLPKGNKTVVLYLPCDSETEITEFFINGNYSKTNKRKTNVLCLGDSITNGYGSYVTSFTYINVMNRIMNFNIVNQGIGGYYYDYKSLMKLDNFSPDKIIVSLGTNQIYSTDTKETIELFYNKLNELYPNIPTYVITPIYRGDVKDSNNLISNISNMILDKCSKYSNIKIIDGYKLIPHLSYFYLDNLHPNSLGMQIYGTNLANELKK